MDESFIIVSVITTLGGLCGLLLLDRNWFRRERFKLERDTLKQENNLRFKKMAQDMGLNRKSTPPSINAPGPENQGIASFLPLLSQLAPEQIGDIVGILSGKTAPDEAAPQDDGGLPAGLDGLLEFASKNPELVKGFLSGMNKGENPQLSENLY